jgi:hypothetical protein
MDLILSPAIPTLCNPSSTAEPSKILALLITRLHALSSLNFMFGLLFCTMSLKSYGMRANKPKHIETSPAPLRRPLNEEKA